MGRGIGSYPRKKYRDEIKASELCRYCLHHHETIHVEHIHPINRGGNSEPRNLTAACMRCNSLKGTFTISEFHWRVMDKMTACRADVKKFIKRLRKERKSHPRNPRLTVFLVDKIIKCRRDHNYYKRISLSIQNEFFYFYQ